MSSYTIYYTCLSALNIRNSNPVKVLSQLEKGEIKPDTAGEKRDGVLHEYALKLPQGRDAGKSASAVTKRLDFFEDYWSEEQTTQVSSTMDADVAQGNNLSAVTVDSGISFREDAHSESKALEDVYGILTNEPALKLALQAANRKGQCIDELIIAVTTSTYSQSKLTCAGAQEVYGRDHTRGGKSCGRRICDELTEILDKGSTEFCEIQTFSDCKLSLGDGESSNYDPSNWGSTLDYFLMEIRSYCTNVLKRNPDKMIRRISIYPLSDDARRGEMTNCAISVAQKAIDAQKEHEDINLMIDTNGGPRDMLVFQLATIRALKVHGISTRYALYSKFNPKDRASYWGNANACQVSDKTYEYEIFDVVSGTDEFVEYGRVDRLLDYFRMTESGILPVLMSVKRMSEAFMTCFTDDMVQSVVEVKGRIEEFETLHGSDVEEADLLQGKGEEKGTNRTYYKLAQYVVGQIRDDMAEVLDAVGDVREREGSSLPAVRWLGNGGSSADETDERLYELVDETGEARAVLPLIEWCRRKKFFQQAYTLYVDRIDSWYRINDILKTPPQQTNQAPNGQQEKTDLYSRLYVDVFEMKYKGLAEQYANTVPGLPFDKNTYLSLLKVEQAHNYVRPNALDDRIEMIQNNIDANGNNHGIDLKPKQILEHAKQLWRDISDHPGQYVTGAGNKQSGRKDTLTSKILPKFPKNGLIQTLTVWRNRPDLHLETSLMDAVIVDIRNGYDDYGMVITNYTMQGINRLMKKAPDNLYKFVHENLSSCYRKLCREHIAGTELGNHIAQDILDALAENGEKPKDTYIRKKIAITHYSTSFAQNLVGTAIDPSKAYDLIVDMARYYLAFKIIRNNSNHSNGKGDAYAYETCKWLSGLTSDASDLEPVLDADTCFFNNTDYTVSFGYQTTERLLDQALQFNQKILRELRQRSEEDILLCR